METTDLKSRTFIIVEILEYNSALPAIKTIIRKTKGNVNAVTFNSDDAFTEKISAVDTFIQVIEGKVEILRNDESHWLETGQSIIIPARALLIIKHDLSFKLISTTIVRGHDYSNQDENIKAKLISICE